MPIPQRLEQIAIFRQPEQESGIRALVLLLPGSLAFVSAGSPIHYSKPSSRSSRSNQWK